MSILLKGECSFLILLKGECSSYISMWRLPPCDTWRNIKLWLIIESNDNLCISLVIQSIIFSYICRSKHQDVVDNTSHIPFLNWFRVQSTFLFCFPPCMGIILLIHLMHVLVCLIEVCEVRRCDDWFLGQNHYFLSTSSRNNDLVCLFLCFPSVCSSAINTCTRGSRYIPGKQYLLVVNSTWGTSILFIGVVGWWYQ